MTNIETKKDLYQLLCGSDDREILVDCIEGVITDAIDIDTGPAQWAEAVVAAIEVSAMNNLTGE